MITIGRVNGSVPSGATIIRADRMTPLGNPFYMKDESHRDAVCDAFQEHLITCVTTKSGVLYEALRELYVICKNNNHVHLQCWCSPKRCHCDSIKMFIESKLNQAHSKRLMLIDD